MKARFPLVMLAIIFVLLCAACTPPTDPAPAASPGNISAGIEPMPTIAMLDADEFNYGTPYLRMSAGLGLSLPLNTWNAWVVVDKTPLFFSFHAEAGKTYTLFWDEHEGSSGYFTYDFKMGAYQRDKATRLKDWNSDIDKGYATGKSFTVDVSQQVWFSVVPEITGSYPVGASFALKLSDGGTTSNQSFAWFDNGSVIAGATDFFYKPDCTALSPGNHRFSVVITRNGNLFSSEYLYTK